MSGDLAAVLPPESRIQSMSVRLRSRVRRRAEQAVAYDIRPGWAKRG